MTETWKPYPRNPRYLISNAGRVQGPRGKITDGVHASSTYAKVAIFLNGERKMVSVHVLVLETFVGPKPEGMESLHKNGDPLDNRASNLRWGTKKENWADRRAHGNDEKLTKTHCSRGHELAEWNRPRGKIKKGRRACKACGNARSKLNGRLRRRGETWAEADLQLEADERFTILAAAARGSRW